MDDAKTKNVVALTVTEEEEEEEKGFASGRHAQAHAFVPLAEPHTPVPLIAETLERDTHYIPSCPRSTVVQWKKANHPRRNERECHWLCTNVVHIYLSRCQGAKWFRGENEHEVK